MQVGRGVMLYNKLITFQAKMRPFMSVMKNKLFSCFELLFLSISEHILLI